MNERSKFDDELNMLLAFGSGNEKHNPRAAVLDDLRSYTGELTGELLGEYMIDLKTLTITSVDKADDKQTLDRD